MSTTNNRGRGRPPVDSELLRFRDDRQVIEAIDAFASDGDVNADAPITRPEAIRRLVREALEKAGYLKP